ncbi:MAG: hypothetical protein PHP51_00100 [Desulfotomaculaceae bacterium]|nr:hypothetical protein [Desulfotomaculaceae bacterium]MDD4766212.1 hypothetical protein [Desulfotomaculaceae bacterium]
MNNFVSNARAYVAFQVQFNPKLKEKLVLKSYETGISQRAIVEEALKCYFESNEAQGGSVAKTSLTKQQVIKQLNNE